VTNPCADRHALHEALPCRSAADDRRCPNRAAIADADAARIIGIWLAFRARLLAANSIESALRDFLRDGVDVPPVVRHHLTQ